MGLFDDLLQPYQPEPLPGRLGLFGDLLQPYKPAADDWRADALPDEKLDELYPDVPFDWGSAARLAGTEAISGAPAVAGMVSGAAQWLDKPADPEAPPVLDAVRRGLGATPIGLGMRAGERVRGALGVTGAVDTANKALEAEREEESARVRASAPIFGDFAVNASRIAGAGIDPTNAFGTVALARGGKALTKALPEAWSPLKKFLLQDLMGGADEAAPAVRGVDHYFQSTPESFEVPLDSLTRTVFDGPAKLERARQLMETMELGPRAPITVRKAAEGGYEIVDGNATVEALRGMGVKTARATLEAPKATTYRAEIAALDVDDAQKANLVAHWEKAESVKPKYDAAVRSVVGDLERSGVVVSFKPMLPDLKGVARGIEKANGKYAGDPGRIQDVVRGTIVIDEVEDVPAVIAAAEARFGKATSLENSLGRDLPPKKKGGSYRDVQMIFDVDGHKVELQLNLPEMIEAKEKWGHPLYEKVRVIEEKALAEGRNPTAEEWSEIQGLRAEQNVFYARAWAAAQKPRNSRSFTDLARSNSEILYLRGGASSQARHSPVLGNSVTGTTPSSIANSVPGGNVSGSRAISVSGDSLALPDDSPEILGRESIRFLPGSVEPVRGRFVVRDAATIDASHTPDFAPNPSYPTGTGAQPRNLEHPAERLGVEGIAARWNPELDDASQYLSTGVPSFKRRGAGLPYVVIGNGRKLARDRALDDPGKFAEHIAALGRKLHDFGLPEDTLEQASRAGMGKPVVSFEILDPISDARLGAEGNVSVTKALTHVDLAAVDARKITPGVLDLYVDGSQLDSAANRDFVRGFLGEVVPQGEHALMIGPHGELAASGERRIRNALLSRAYRDPDLVSILIDSEAEGIRNVGLGMAANAGRFARLAAMAESGAVLARDIGSDVALAARKLSDLRAKRMPVEMYLEQTVLFGHELTPEARQLLGAFNDLRKDRSAPAGILRRYADLVESLGGRGQVSILKVPSKDELLDEAIRTWKVSEEPLLFPGGATGIVAGLADVLPAPWGAIVRHANLSKLTAIARRWLANFGDFSALGKIAPEVAEATRLSQAERAAHEMRATTNLRDYEVALKAFQRELSESGIHRSDDEISEQVLAGLVGENDLAGLSPALQEIAVRMRAHVDELTGGILNSQELTTELRYVLGQNQGSYLRRTFEIHRDAQGWKKIVQEQEPWRWAGAKRWVGEQHPEWTDDQIERYLNGFFTRQPDAATAIAPRSDVFRIEKGLFKHRIRQHLVHIEGESTRVYPTKEAANKAAGELRGLGKKATVTEEEGLPKELEDFLGLHTDPRVRYAESVARMAHDLSTAKLFGEIRQLGEGTIFFGEGMGPGSFAAKINGDPAFNPLAGMYTTPEVRAVIEAMGRSSEAPAWLEKLYAANAAVRAGKTVGSPLTHVRNFLSWNFMLASNGHFASMVNVPRVWRLAKVSLAPKIAMQGRIHRGIEGLADALETAGGKRLSEVFRMDLPALRARNEMAVRLGVIQEGARSQEIARYLGLVSETKAAGMLGKTKIGKAVGWVAGKARSLYMLEDDLPKQLFWEAEAANLKFALPHLSDDEALEMAAPLVRDLSPTYSKASPAVRAIRDFPFFGDFPTFWAEIIRTSKNTLKRGAWEVAQLKTNPRMALIGAKRLAGFGTVLAAPVAIVAATRARLGISSEELEAAREFAPEWNKNADLVPVEKKGPGQYSLLDGGYINPYAMFREAWTALTANGYKWDERLEGMFDELRAPFTNEGILAGTAIDLARNRDTYGREIYPEFGTRWEKAAAMAKHVKDRLQPGAVSQTQDVYAGVTGEVNPRTGRLVDIETLAYSWFTGTRQLEIDVPSRLSGSVKGLQRARSEIVGEWNRAKLKTSGPTPELLDKKASANAQWKAALGEQRRKIAKARATGLSDYQIRQILTDAEIGKPTIDALMGDYDFEVVR